MTVNSFFHDFAKAAMLLFVGILISMMTPDFASGDSRIKLLLTSNLNGRFAVSAENQDAEDPMLIMAQSLIYEQKTKPADLFLDMGNAFYPGLLSRFSYGSIMMNFLENFNCAATLVSSQDLKIGISNLSFLGKEKNTRLLSANMEQNGKPLFLPYFIQSVNGKKLAFIGISSEKGFFDIAEKRLLNVTIKKFNAALEKHIAELKKQDIDYLVLISGRSYADNLSMMQQFSEISLCISGGDATGDLFASKAERVDIDSGRSIVTLTNPGGYYTLTLSAGKNLAVDVFAFHATGNIPTRDNKYVEFSNRLAIWKERFAEEGGEVVVADSCCEVYADDARVAQLLRHRYGAEVAILEKNTIAAREISGKITSSDILKMVNNEFPIFTFRISGSELRQVTGSAKDFVIIGTDGDTVQRYPIQNMRNYLICSPQSVYDRLVKQLGRDIKYTNSWKSISDEIKDDLKGDRVIGYEDYGYIDSRFRVLVDAYLSNFYDRSNVSRGKNIDTPPGKPTDSYQKLGLEDKIDFTVYNQYHKFVFTPYIFYIRQDNTYFQNLLRGTLFYTYNLSPAAKPYHKSQVDTVVREANNLRPLLFRETFGALFENEYITGKVGLGFEKQVRDPEEDLSSGIETIIAAKYDFLDNLSYAFNLDTFYSIKRVDFSSRQIRAEITNALSCKLNSFMAFSMKHKWFYFYSMEYEESYKESRILLTLDLQADLKFF